VRQRNIVKTKTFHNVRQRNIVKANEEIIGFFGDRRKHMIQNGMYYMTDEYKELVKSIGGQWNDTKKRPMACVLQSTENPDIFWAIPVGKVNHRDEQALNRIRTFMEYRDIRGPYYHIGRTTNKSIFFISDAVPITDKYILEPHYDINKKPYVIKNPKLLLELNKKLKRILNWENSRPNYFRQHMTDVKKYLLEELKNERQTI
jgi:hypothetical protein